MKRFIKALTPRPFILAYHYALARAAAMRYGNPSKKMFVIGVTGTNGKTTVSNLIASIFQEAGYKSGCATTTNFRVGTCDRLNDTKQTMVGRFKLQKFLKELADNKVKYAVVETSSEGIVQYRHSAIDYRAAVFTNLTPEHIESHGSLEKYRGAKEKLFEKVAREHPKDSIGVYNLDSEHVDYFLKYPIAKKYGFTFKKDIQKPGVRTLKVLDYTVSANRIEFTVEFRKEQHRFSLNMRGKFNIENCLSAICMALAKGISFRVADRALQKISFIPGRLEFISEGQDFKVLVDYAPEPESMKQLYEFIDVYKKEENINRIIHVTGSAGGGRDKSRRPILGRFVAERAAVVVVTNEDPYDEDPQEIIDQVAAGAIEKGKVLGTDLFKIMDREEALEFAITHAQKNDLVVLTGKGSEQAIVVKNNKKVPWDEREVARKILRKLTNH